MCVWGLDDLDCGSGFCSSSCNLGLRVFGVGFRRSMHSFGVEIQGLGFRVTRVGCRI